MGPLTESDAVGESPPTQLLSTPQRQLPIAIVAGLFDASTLRQLGEVLFPVVIVGVTAGGRLSFVLLPFAILLTIALVALRWWRTTFWVEDDELILQSGILSRTRLQLPLDRIQQISTEQGIVQQIFDVRKVAVETAGSTGAEFTLTAVSNAVVAELRQLVVGADRQMPPEPGTIDLAPGLEPPTGPPVVTGAPVGFPAGGAQRKGEVVLNHSLQDLVQVGLVRPGGQLLSAIVAMLGLGLGSTIDRFVESRLTSVLAQVTFGGGALVFAAVALIGGAVIRDYDLTVWRSEQGLRLTAGLVTKREQFARTERVQLVRSRANPLERMLSRTTVVLPQASASAGGDNANGVSTKNVLIPSAPDALVPQLPQLVVPSAPADLTRGISERARRRWSLFGGIWPGVFFAAYAVIVVIFDGPRRLVVVALCLAAVAVAVGFTVASASQRRWRWELGEELLSIRHGVVFDQRTDVEVRKVQSVGVERGWWQRRHGLASISCNTAGGSVHIPHLDLAVAEGLRDHVLATVEQSPGPWM